MSLFLNLLGKRHRLRIEALKRDIRDKGIDGAIEFAEAALHDDGGSNIQAKTALAFAQISLFPDNPNKWAWDAETDCHLRLRSSELLKNGSSIPPELGLFAAWAILHAPIERRRGRPSNKWQKTAICQIMLQLRDAGVPVYYGDDTIGTAQFTAVEVITKIIEIEERTLRELWQKRVDFLGDI
jgi:hypothetical protein